MRSSLAWWSASDGRQSFSGGGSFSDTPLDPRASRYFTDLLGGFYDESDPQALQSLLDMQMMSPGEVMANSPETSAIRELVTAGRSVSGVLNIANGWALNNPDKLMELQVQLMQHGFVSSPLTFGVFDNATVGAISAMIEGKWLSGTEQSMDAYLADAHKSYFDQTFEQGMQDLSAADAAAAEELTALRSQIESIDLTVPLSNSGVLEANMQQMAVQQLGRRLNDTELSTIIDQVHEKERTEFWNRSPQVQRYNELVKAWTDAVSNNSDRTSQVIAGTDSSDLDAFMNAIMSQESGGNPNAVNKDSGAFGLFQFMPGTWRETTARAGLDPNDKSATNQKAAARYLMASYFKQFGNWRDVAIAWYAGPGNVRRTGVHNASQGNYPTISSYADQVVQRMANPMASQTDKGLDPGSLRNWLLSQAADVLDTIGQPRQDIDLSTPVARQGEYEPFDVGSFLKSAITETGGVDQDVYSFVKTYSMFDDLLGKR